MNARRIVLGVAEGGELVVDLDRLLQTRLLIQGASGAGKSYAVRRLVEETNGALQQLLLDPEDEYASLREQFEFVLGGPGRDFAVEPRSARKLAGRLLELGASAVLNLSDLTLDAQHAFAQSFLDGLIALPKSQHRGALVIVDEAQRLAPQTGGDPECTRAVIDLFQRGRKRGLVGVAVCPRISDLHKSVVALAQNRLIGCTTLDLDVRRAAYELGFRPNDGAQLLRSLPPGRFFAVGPALSRAVVEVKIGPVRTTHGTQGGALPPPPAPANVRALLARLADLPAEAVEEERAVDALEARVRQLTDELETLRGATHAEDLERAGAARREAMQALDELAAGVMERERQILVALERAKDGIKAAAHALADPADVLAGAASLLGRPLRIVRAPDPEPAPVHTHPPPPPAPLRGGRPCEPKQRILDVLAALASAGVTTPVRAQVALLCGYTNPASGGFSEPCAVLRREGLVEYAGGGRLELTDRGRDQARAPERPATSADLQGALLAQLGGPERDVLRVLIHAYPSARVRADLAAELGYTNPASGGFSEPVGRLRRLGLLTIPSPGEIRAADVLFIRR